MKRFGFYKDPEVQLPDTQKAPSGIYNSDGKLVEDSFDIARVAIGQGGEEGQIRATVTQMAEVAATIANGGTLMKPTFIQQVVDPDGRVSDELDPEVQSDVVSSDTAAQLAQMMTSVVDEGTAAALQGDLGGTTFAGKTGTAEINIPNDIAQAWFIAFAPVDDPQIAVAATVERCQGCFGGDGRPDRNRSDAGAPQRMKLEPGLTVDGRYKLIDRIGSGGHGRRLARPRHGAGPRRRPEAAARELRP